MGVAFALVVGWFSDCWMLSGVFEVLMALALVLSSLLYVDIFSITSK